MIAKPGVAGESSVMVVRRYSTYCKKLEKHRYIEKLNSEVVDPYAMPVPASPCSDSLLEVDYPVYTIALLIHLVL